MSENIYFAAFFFPSLALVLIFSMRYLSEMVKAKLRLGQEEAYREMVVKAIDVQAETTAALSSFGTTLSAIQNRLAVLEKILKDVE